MTADYAAEDFVYVDPGKREVLGRVQWSESGEPLKMEKAAFDGDEEEEPCPPGQRKKRKRKKQYYPWGTYRSMKKLFRLEGKEKEIERYKPLEEVMTLALEQPYWNA